ncbi:hypothetical protein DPEC_G00174850 [Dallia pectoralis]|uniref:Uncharacterized protein n=1 Tax=Dallia pectoralis TaxID=75939 RepID=A0ACC2GEE7_DALPE|nr:hypothetical protein DPEC_G00174850 [Dallia pectoralis]
MPLSPVCELHPTGAPGHAKIICTMGFFFIGEKSLNDRTASGMNAIAGTIMRYGCVETVKQPRLFAAVIGSRMMCSSKADRPVVAAKLPFRVKVTGSKQYAWCACGHSKRQPFCDGSHRTKAPSISPVLFTPKKDRTVMLCACFIPFSMVPLITASKVQLCTLPTEPGIAAKKPFKVALIGGKQYSWCTCGYSRKQPFCDGSHKTKTQGLIPLRFVPEKDCKVWLCGCKNTANPPYCDGTHNQEFIQSALLLENKD